jgi:hypothetical protein
VRILFVATKAPWPPRDGGRLLLLETLKALAPLGHEAHLVAPADGDGVDPSEAVRELSAFCVPHLVAAPRNGGFAAMVRSLRSGEPLSIARHARLALRAAVSEQLEARAFDIVHAEQLQALDACAAAFTRGAPVVLRAQNVESDLWAASARGRGLRGRLLRLEAARLEAFEARALERVSLTLALTDPDARRLREMSHGVRGSSVSPLRFRANSCLRPSTERAGPVSFCSAARGGAPTKKACAGFKKPSGPARSSASRPPSFTSSVSEARGPPRCTRIPLLPTARSPFSKGPFLRFPSRSPRECA